MLYSSHNISAFVHKTKRVIENSHSEYDKREGFQASVNSFDTAIIL